MRRLSAVAAFLCASAISVAARAPVFASDPEAALRSQVEAFGSAFSSGDFDAVAGMIAARYLHTNSASSPIDRDAWLGWYRRYAEEIRAGARRFTEYRIDELQIEVFGDAAVVAGVVRASGKADGASFEQNIRATNVWVLEDGAWKRAGFHDVAITE